MDNFTQFKSWADKASPADIGQATGVLLRKLGATQPGGGDTAVKQAIGNDPQVERGYRYLEQHFATQRETAG